MLVTSFDGLGVGFEGPQAPSPGRNPSDNSLAVGPDHIVQTVNTRLAIFTKKGKKYDTTGKVLYGAVPTTRSLPASAARAKRATTATLSCATTSSRIAG